MTRGVRLRATDDGRRPARQRREPGSLAPGGGRRHPGGGDLEPGVGYGDPMRLRGSDSGDGPADEELQTRNIKQVMDSLKAALYAFQEVYSQEAMDDLADLPAGGCEGFVAAPHRLDPENGLALRRPRRGDRRLRRR
ncbi:MAG: hypothetical protein U5K31_12675 [Balneolaceae bacterium]|nr:hypothetical protein [Balneolaceae bacterium]